MLEVEKNGKVDIFKVLHNENTSNRMITFGFEYEKIPFQSITTVENNYAECKNPPLDLFKRKIDINGIMATPEMRIVLRILDFLLDIFPRRRL